ncbi:hypothetical protein QBC43DRAFT_297548 [Cladorrhinum sp. PSN259]|nr:hypothetical protein QBC43DRAFT_297548 [Cladorrhinum sp. PSN259]
MVTAVDLGTCKANIQARLDNNTLTRNASIFYFNGTKYMSERDNIALTIEGCQANCPKPYFDLYRDMWPRLLTWLVPALLLVGSVHLPRIGHLNRLFVIFHYMGDPVDSMWSLLTKGEIWNRFYALALRATPEGPDQLPTAKALAAVFVAYEELTGDMETVQQEFNAAITENRQLPRDDLAHILKETAEELVDSRPNEGLRTALVIVNYLWAVLAALVPNIGGVQSSQPGGRIGTAMFLSWLVTAVLLSNTLSGFTSRRTCLRIMERCLRTIKGRRRDLHVFPYSPRLLSKTTGTSSGQEFEDIMSAQPWSGSVYSYRPCKRLTPTHARSDRSPLHLLALSLLPPFVSSVCAFVIIFYTPTIGLGCRTLWVLALTVGIFVSPLLSFLISHFFRPKYAWYLTILKDAFFGLSAVAVILLSSIGIFNTCWCWSGVYSRGIAKAYIDLDPQDEREYNLHHLYPAAVGVCLLLQVAVYGLMHRVMKEGGLVMRQREEEKMSVYREVHGLPTPNVGMEMKARRESEAAPLLLLPETAIQEGSPVLGWNASSPSPKLSGATTTGVGTGLLV